MTDTASAPTRDYSETLFLPKTAFPMRAGLPEREPQLLWRWERIGLYQRLRREAKGREAFVLHDGPPYANGHLHIGHALNKILKDIVTRSKQMSGFDANYVPGWDCHGLPIEWKVEEQYRAEGRTKDEVPVLDIRRDCRAYADHWIGVQSEEFQRLGVTGDWRDRYATMDFRSEAVIAGEVMKFALSGQLYRGSKPVMWSVVEKTALAEAEVEYEDYTSDTVWVKFPVIAASPSSRPERSAEPGSRTTDVAGQDGGPGSRIASGVRDDSGLDGASVVIWTTTPWTIPGNRAISFSSRIPYGLYRLTAPAADGGPAGPHGGEDHGARSPGWRDGEFVIVADSLAEAVFSQAKAAGIRERAVTAAELATLVCRHPLHGRGYDFLVPLLDGDHVTDDAGTGFVHTAPGHGREDYDIWMKMKRELEARGIVTDIPYTVDADGRFTKDAPGFEGRQVITEAGEKGDANKAVMDALAEAGTLLARGRLKHQYPHSWRSKKPVIFRNTPQWFIAMDKAIEGAGDTLRARALGAIAETTFYPPQGQNRLRGMIEARPDWVISRQRAWGVPIAVFVDPDTGEVLKDEAVNARIMEAFTAEGADAWYREGARERFLGGHAGANWQKVDDILDVWFESGSTHEFVLRARPDLKWPADMYLEGSDQHRGWFHSSLLESCGVNGRAPYDSVLTHGFVLDEHGRKMSKSLGNTVTPQDVIAKSGADILRLWVAASDYADDLRIGPEILKTTVDTYRKLRNTIRWMLGTLAHHRPQDDVAAADMPELERYMLHRLAEVGEAVRAGYDAYDYKRIFATLITFMTSDLSAFYFDVRKDALYCDPISSVRRRAALTVVDRVFDAVVRWLAPILPFTAEEAWLDRRPSGDGTVHAELFPEIPAGWRDDALAAKWEKVRRVRRVVTGALEIERAAKRMGSSLEAAPAVHVSDPDLAAALEGIDLAEALITSDATLVAGEGPDGAFRLPEVKGVAVVPVRAEGRKCARSWKITPQVGADPEFPDITPRDAQAMREWQAARS